MATAAVSTSATEVAVASEKASRVRGVFDSVAPKYDVMNDLMSMGLHRAWKAYTMLVANVKPGRVMFEIDGVSRAVAEEAFTLAAAKLPIKTKIISRLGL